MVYPRKIWRRPALLLGVIAVSVAATVLPAGSSVVPGEAANLLLRVGVSYGDTLVWMPDGQLAAALDDAVMLGAGWVRADLSWADVQYNGPGAYRWSPFDRVVAAATERGLTVLPVLAYTPPWARPKGCVSASCEPAEPDVFAAFARAAVQRFAPRHVHTWEIWNEPNAMGFWKPAPSPTAYTVLLRSVRRAIRGADPSARLVLGGLAAAGPDAGRGTISQTGFLAAVSALGGNRLVDAVGYHPYTYPYLPGATTSFGTAWEKMDRDGHSLRSVLASSGTPDLPLWITEVGAPTGGPGSASDGRSSTIGPATTHVTEARQAQIAADAIRSAAADPGVAAVMWYSDRDLSDDPSSNGNFFGLRRADGTAKPAFASLRAAIAALAVSPASGRSRDIDR